MAKEELRGCAAITRHGETIELQQYSPVAVAPKPCAVVIRRASTPLSFPLAPVPLCREQVCVYGVSR
jgi:hypothetical protein